MVTTSGWGGTCIPGRSHTATPLPAKSQALPQAKHSAGSTSSSGSTTLGLRAPTARLTSDNSTAWPWPHRVRVIVTFSSGCLREAQRAGARRCSSTSVPGLPDLAWLCPGRLSLQPAGCTSLAPLPTFMLLRQKTLAPSTAAAPAEVSLSSISLCPSGWSSAGKSVTSRKHPPKETSTSPLFHFPR